jgi:hypothetical protein
MTRLPLRGLVAGLALLSLAAALAACQETEETPPPLETKEASATPTASASETPSASVAATATQPARTPGPGETLWRWGNVSVIVPDESGIIVRRDLAHPTNPGDGGPMICLTVAHPDTGLYSAMCVDADTGAVLSREVAEVDKTSIDSAIATLRIDVAAADSLPWPYSPVRPEEGKQRQKNVTYWEPDPAAGVTVHLVVSDFVGGTGEFLVLQNVRSKRVVDAASGKVVITNDRIAPEDAVAFERWSESIEIANQ